MNINYWFERVRTRYFSTGGGGGRGEGRDGRGRGFCLIKDGV